MLNAIGSRWSDSSASTITISAPGAGKYNMLKTLSAYSDATSSIHVTGASTTTILWAGLSGAVTPLVISFPDGAEPVAAENTVMKITKGAGTVRMSVTGKKSSP